MPLFKIKKGDRAAASLMPSWHPNFRNFDRLPDVKAVRTSFFVNCAAIVITAGFSLYFGWQEYSLHAIRVQISDSQRQIDYNQKPSEQAVQLYQQFQAEEQKVAEVAEFVKTDFVRSDFVIGLGQSLPKNIALDTIDVQESEVSLRGIVRGASSDDAFGQAQTYINQLQDDSSLSQRFATITMPTIDLASKADQINFEISMRSKNGRKP
jgi:hypothetical protein